MRRRAATAFGVAALLAVSGCGHTTSDTTSPTPTLTDDVGTAYREALAGLDRRYFDGMEMSSPTVLRQVLLVSEGGADQMIAEWEGELASGAAAALLTKPGQLTRVDVFEHSAGTTVPPDPDSGYGVAPHPVPVLHDSDSELEARVAAVLRDFHLTPTTLRVLHPLGPAVVVEATADSAASVDGRMGDLESALDAAGMSRLDGMYVTVSGPDGPLFRGERAARIAAGGQWFAPGFDSGIPHG